MSVFFQFVLLLFFLFSQTFWKCFVAKLLFVVPFALWKTIKKKKRSRNTVDFNNNGKSNNVFFFSPVQLNYASAIAIMSQSRRLFDWWIWNAYGRTHTHTLTYRFYRNDEFDTIQWILVRGFFFLSSTSTLSPNQVNWSECIWELFFFFWFWLLFRLCSFDTWILHLSFCIFH